MEHQRDLGSDVTDKILETAETLFSRKGFSVSLREITAAADVNIAAVNYYFGSKGKLTEAVFDRLSERINSERITALEEVLASAREQNRKPDIRCIIKVFIRPYLYPSEQGQLLAHLILQHRIERSPLTNTIIKRHFDPMAAKFIDAFRIAMDSMPPESFYWRYVFMVGSIVLTITDIGQDNRIGRLSDGRITTEIEAMERELVEFLTGGMTAPPVQG